VLSTCTTSLGCMPTLARHVWGAGTGCTGFSLRTGETVRRTGAGLIGLWRRTGDLEHRAGTRRAGLGRHTGGLVRVDGTVFTRWLARTSGRVWRADSGDTEDTLRRANVVPHAPTQQLSHSSLLQSPHQLSQVRA
jgi:hypothetical protein